MATPSRKTLGLCLIDTGPPSQALEVYLTKWAESGNEGYLVLGLNSLISVVNNQAEQIRLLNHQVYQLQLGGPRF